MENSEQSLGNKEIPLYPKPGDELQKHIETVIPDDEKEAIDSANAAPEQAVATQSAIAPNTGKSDLDEEGSNVVKDQEKENDSSSEAEANTPKEPSEEQAKDEGDGIETVSN
jgi:hypothetical protein